MNLIEISNQLKDVPDQFLMKEVQSPSGAYPSYLIISELTRRKWRTTPRQPHQSKIQTRQD